jgi:hypothetical protein
VNSNGQAYVLPDAGQAQTPRWHFLSALDVIENHESSSSAEPEEWSREDLGDA